MIDHDSEAIPIWVMTVFTYYVFCHFKVSLDEMRVFPRISHIKPETSLRYHPPSSTHPALIGASAFAFNKYPHKQGFIWPRLKRPYSSTPVFDKFLSFFLSL